MREHAIPQDVTGYRFHIIGSMTLKQFGIVAAGFIAAFIINGFGLPMVIKWTLMIGCGALGLIIAFVPFEERPLDHWVITFVKAMYRPTKFYWKRKAKVPSFFNYVAKKNLLEPAVKVDLSGVRKKRFQEYVQTIKTSRGDQKESSPWDNYQNERISFIINEFSTSKAKASDVKKMEKKPQLKVRVRSLVKDLDDVGPITVFSAKNKPAQTSVKTTRVASNTPQQSAMLTKQTAPIAPMVSTVRLTSDSSPQKAPSPQLGQVLTIEKDSDNKQLKKTIKTPIATAAQTNIRVKKTTTKKSKKLKSQKLNKNQVYSQNKASMKAGSSSQIITTSKNLPFPSPPKIANSIVGMILTPQDKMISDAYVEIKSSKGEVLKSAKTNSLGQFFISDPLKKGKYTINIQKDGFNFKTYQIQMKNKIINPLEIRSI